MCERGVGKGNELWHLDTHVLHYLSDSFGSCLPLGTCYSSYTWGSSSTRTHITLQLSSAQRPWCEAVREQAGPPFRSWANLQCHWEPGRIICSCWTSGQAIGMAVFSLYTECEVIIWLMFFFQNIYLDGRNCSGKMSFFPKSKASGDFLCFAHRFSLRRYLRLIPMFSHLISVQGITKEKQK